MIFDLTRYRTALMSVTPIETYGVITRAVGLTVEATGVDARIGDYCQVVSPNHHASVLMEVVGFRDDHLLLMPFSELAGVRPGSQIRLAGSKRLVPSGDGLLGRVIDAMGNPIDGLGPLEGIEFAPLHTEPITAMDRPQIHDPLPTGVKVIDGLLTCGIGQRLGVFAGSGVGKSTLLGMIARGAQADVVVIGLVGERGREVQDFISKNLGPEGLQKAVVVVATSDQPALMRLKAAWMATAVAETFRDNGARVLLLIDSLTRFAMAQREIGLATGEPPALRGYTPSVFALLPRLLERSGNTSRGSITAFYTVLVEGDDMNEPVADTVRGVLDGHIVLSRAMAAENIYPAIDILHSISRTMPDVASSSHMAIVAKIRDMLSTYERHRDLIAIGAYVSGTNPLIDAAIALLPRLRTFQHQLFTELVPFESVIAQIEQLMSTTPF